MLYIVGLGLNEKGISVEGLEDIKKCSKIYLEGYTVEFTYSIDKIEKVIGKKVIKLIREDVEGNRLIREAKKENICLLVYGCPLFATTHISLLIDCRKNKIKTKIIYSASVFDAIAETGLQLYKFGKISSMPKWQKNFSPDSFLDFVIENRKIDAHSLILVDIGLGFNDALNELKIASEKRKMKIDKIVVCSSLGTYKSDIYYEEIGKLKGKKVNAPFCFIIPGKMHFLEEEVLKNYGV